MIAVQSLVILAGIMIMLYGGNSLTPAINEARRRRARWRAPVRASSIAARSWLNALVLLIGPGSLDRLCDSPRTANLGDRRADALEQVRYDNAINRLIVDVEARHGMRPLGSGPRRVPRPRPDDRRRDREGSRIVLRPQAAADEAPRGDATAN